MLSAALEYLNRDRLAHADLLVPLNRGSAHIIAAGPQGVLLYEQVSGAHMLAADCDRAALALLEQVSAPTLLDIHNRAAALEAERRFGLSISLTCNQAVWTADKPPAKPYLPYTMRRLEPCYGGTVERLYAHDIGRAYIEARLNRGELWGAFDGSALVGFIGTHAEGAMGMLEVAPSHRRRGVGIMLAAHMIAVQLKAGLLPYAQFTVDNHASRQLNQRLGMSITEHVIHWLE